MTFVTVIIFVVIFSLLVLAHEWGHYAAAIRAGIQVDEFGLGLPPRLWGKKIGKTIYSLNLIPFGGFVKIKGEGAPIGEDDDDSIRSKSYGARLLVMAGGVLMNFLLAYVLMAAGFWMGMPPIVSDVSDYVTDPQRVVSQVLILNVNSKSPAEVAGLKTGDIILAVDGQAVETVKDFQAHLTGKKEVMLSVQRNGQTQQLGTTTLVSEGKTVIGVLADELADQVQYVWWKVPYLALVELWRTTAMIAIAVWSFLVSLVSTASLPDSLAGPVGIAKITSEAIQLGWLSVLQFIIFLSINLGLINILPFPALDGGRIAFLLAEMLRGGKRVTPEIENAIHNLGFLLLLALIFTVTYKDILKFF